MTEITNISGGLIVCDLENGETLRLNNKVTVALNDGDITKYLENLSRKGKVRIRKQIPVQQKAVTTQKKGKEE